MHLVRYGTGAGVDPSVRDAFEARFQIPLVEAWGMTETSRAILNSEEPRSRAPRTFGRPRPPWQARIVDSEDQTLPFGQPGELLVRSEGPDPRAGFFSGYVNLPEETEHAWRGGWFHTGDVCRQDADGTLYFVDRMKNIVRRSGENIAAAEVEDALLSLPQAKTVAVIAVEDELHDEEIMACVVLNEGFSPNKATAADMQAALASSLNRAKLPAWFVFMSDLPVTGTQKVQKGALFGAEADPRKSADSYDLRTEKRALGQTAQVSKAGQ